MRSDEERQRKGNEADVGARVAEPALPDAQWLLRHKVEVPDPIKGYVRRPEVEQRCALTGHRVTVLHAPGGFGKTALLAHRCRVLRERGLAVAWLSLDEDDGPESVARYLALAFERTGIATFDPAGERGGGSTARAPDPEADSYAEYRIDLLMRALERHGGPCVLALDEVERLQSPDAVGLINTLLRSAPPHLHVGMALRERPPGLAIAMYLLDGDGVTVTAEDLRFSKSRLWRGLSAEDRDYVLDIALFDRLETDLIDEVTDAGHAGRRIASIGSLAGLLSTTGGRESTMRLHPLIKAYCEKQRFEEAPERFRAIHRSIAEALARRGRALEALRHAAEAGDTALLGRIAESTGGIRLWLKEGSEALHTIDGLLTGELLSEHPRLALLRCFALTASGDIDGAQRLYGQTAVETAGYTRDRDGGDDRALQIDHIFVQGLLHMCGCSHHGGGMMATVAEAEAMANAADTDPLLRGMFSLGMCIAYNQRTAFDTATEWGGRARAALGRASPYLAPLDFQTGSVAMARGRPREARQCYDRALQIARASHLRDAGAVMIGEALSAELEVERSAGALWVDGPQVSPRLLGRCFAWLDVYAASTGSRVELALLSGGPEAALALVEDAREYARRTERPALARFLSALRVAVLLDKGEVDEAARAWRFDRLPEQAAECLDLGSLSWREMEMLACARLRLLIARGEFDAARQFAAALQAVASERGLVRTRMRGLALSIALEHRAEALDRASAHLVDYLRLFAEADYVRPLARDRTVALALLDDVACATGGDASVAAAAEALRKALCGDAGAEGQRSDRALTGRELDVLARLEHQTDRDIAQALLLSYDGVRYRVRCIFAKLGARSRLDAVQRARARGILPAEEEAPGAD